jgi:hypothetical protein
MRRSSNVPVALAAAATVGLGVILAGCSDLYYDRRETILFGADNAVASNIAVQTIDPWPPGSANRRAPANGERVAAAIRRYRTGRVFTPIGNGTSSTYLQQQQQQLQQQMTQDPPPAASSGAGSGAGGISVGAGTQVK